MDLRKMSLELVPSNTLQRMLEESARYLITFAESWKEILDVGQKEGFTEKQLQEMVRPYLKQRPDMDSKKIWYLFHKEEHNDRTKQNYQSRTINRTNDDKNDIEQKNDHGNEAEYTMVQSTSDLEGTIVRKIDNAVDVVTENEQLKKKNLQLEQALKKTKIGTAADIQLTNDELFDMLPNDSVDTFKNKSGNLLLFERLLVNFKYQKIPKLQWWVRVIK
jgi:hypothetical protein